ncbi:MAG: alpha-amylase, partial [Calditrichia bacterium]|nr:alpha-amylase [Calditrichia bacterium]
MNKVIIAGLIMITLLVLYCEKKHGTGKELADFSKQSVTAAPDWAKNGILYQLFPRVFTEEGTFKALQNNLDYIQDLDVDVIWLLPIYPIGEKGKKGNLGCPFSVRDFRKINPEYGNEKDFKELVDDIHKRGMKIILGMVPNHGSNDNVLMEEHPEWFMRDENDEFIREVADWSDITVFNYDDPGLRKYLLDTYKYWIEEFDIDGYRMDVAGMVPIDFWKHTLAELRKVKPDIYFLAEWEKPEMLINGFNSDYDWTLFHLLRDIRKGKKNSTEAVEYVAQRDGRYPQNSLIMRFLENHDEQRSLNEFGKEAIEAYATFLFTLPGIPLIYA